MADRLVYVSRLTRLPLVGADGADVGRVVDVVLGSGGRPPRVNGFVVQVQRRRVFVGAGRMGEITTECVRLRRGSINLRHFELRAGERLVAGELFGRRIRGRRVVDVGLAPAPEPFAWEVATGALDEMEADDAADLLGEFSASRQAELLEAMDPEEAEPVRRLLTYDPHTAGGLMTPEPIILAPQATVSEALARVRDPDLPVPLASQVFVAQPPL